MNRNTWMGVAPGALLVALVGTLAFALVGTELAMRFGLGAITLAILIGAIASNGLPQLGHGVFRGGLTIAQRHLLRIGVALYGFNLDVQQIAQVGGRAILIDLFVASTTLALGWVIGRRLLRLDPQTVLLTSAGSAFCGAAAVLATMPTLKMSEHEALDKSAAAVATVVLYGTLAMVLYPAIYSFLGSAVADFGIYVGSTVHEVGQVVAIGGMLNEEVANAAIVTKMIRVMMLVPFLLAVSFVLARRDSSGERGAITIPWFALCFVLCAAINSLGCLPDGLVGMLRQTATLCLTAAMAALGIDSQLKRIGRAGLKSLVLGGVLFLHLVLTGGLANWLLA